MSRYALVLVIGLAGLASAITVRGDAPAAAQGVWDWGKLKANDVDYIATFTISNQCDVEARVELTTVDLPYLAGIDWTWCDVAPGDVCDNSIRMHIPAPPCAAGVVNLPTGGRMFPPFGGEIRVSYPGAGDACPARSQRISLKADIVVPTCPGIAEKLQTDDPCTVWWLTGERPARDPDAEARCLEPIRKLAADYREKALVPLAARAPGWEWLPSADQIGRMTIPELLAMKTRAAGVMSGRDAGGF